MDLALQLENVESGYGEVQVLWGVSLEVARGKLTTIIGTNGAGKTTSLRTIMGSIRTWKGRVLLHGEDVTRLSPHAKANRGLVLVPEGRQLFPDMSVEENLEMGGYSKRARKRQKENLDRVYTLFPRLKERRQQKSSTLSGGEQQMLAMGRGLMQEPEVLMIDELSLGLAPVLAQQLFLTLGSLRKQGSLSSWWNRTCISRSRSATTPTCSPKVESTSVESRMRSQEWTKCAAPTLDSKRFSDTPALLRRHSHAIWSWPSWAR